jgi:hypothetical protein
MTRLDVKELHLEIMLYITKSSLLIPIYCNGIKNDDTVNATCQGWIIDFILSKERYSTLTTDSMLSLPQVVSRAHLQHGIDSGPAVGSVNPAFHQSIDDGRRRAQKPDCRPRRALRFQKTTRRCIGGKGKGSARQGIWQI